MSINILKVADLNSILNNSSITSIQWKEQLVTNNYLHYRNLFRFLREDSFKTKQTNICQESTSSQDTWCMFVTKIHWCRVFAAVWMRTQLSSSILLKHVIIKLTVSFFSHFLRASVLFVGPLISLICKLRHLYAMASSHSPLVLHLLISLQLSPFDPLTCPCIQALVGP